MANSSSVSQDIARQTLTDRLLDAVKQCQIRFGGKTELASDSDSRVSCLCTQWETVLQFGIKSNKKLNPLRHVAGQVLLRPEAGESVWWQFVKGHLSSTEIRRFNSLQNITTDVGRARAWLRSALNEQSLEKYLHNFLGNRQLLSSYFEQEALLMDEERSAMLPMMAAGLSSILFAINIDNPEFNISKQNSSTFSSNNQLVSDPSWQAPSPIYSVVSGKENKKRKKKKANVAIASIENVDFEENDSTAELKLGHGNEKREENVRTGYETYSKPLLGVTSENRLDSESSRLDYEGLRQVSNISRDEINSHPRSLDLHKDRKADSFGQTSSDNEPTSGKLLLAADDIAKATDYEPLVELSSGVSLTPVACPDEATLWAGQEMADSESSGNVSTNLSPVALGQFRTPRNDSPVSSGFTTDDDVSEDTSLAIDATEAALSAAQDVHREMADFTRSYLVRTMGDGRTSPTDDSGDTKEMTSGELKQAVVSMMLRKDEVEECNGSLRQLLEKEMSESAALRHEVEDLKKEKSSSQEAYQATMLALSSENDLLKHQLKKYVAAVQSLRRNEPLDIAVPGVLQEDDFPVLPERSEDDDASNDVELGYERKLIQIADMHGELIELNERLQKMLNIREHQLRGLREELINLRGPLPDDTSRDDSFSLDEFGPRLVPVNTRPLINIWIPSAFAQGKSSNVHHTYQVYVRIRDDEWNVYRRYSHFYDMHKKISKQYSGVGNFKFPQKKVIGNRDTKFVEIRRRHLQKYLRKLINYSLKIIPDLSDNPSKSLLLKFFPFFGNSIKDPVPITVDNGQTLYTGL